jgi:hypothetical protein
MNLRQATALVILVAGALAASAADEKLQDAAPQTNSNNASYESLTLSPTPHADFSAPKEKPKSRLRTLFTRPLNLLKPKQLLSGSRRFLQDFNPFNPVPPEPNLAQPGDYNPRAWSTRVGWDPAASAFPDAITAWP